MNKEIIKFEDRGEISEIAWGDNPKFVQLSKDIVDKTRWSIHYRVILQRVSDNKFFETYYSVGATESQDQVPYEDDEMILTEVFPVEKTITVYE